ncbi:MAG: benzoylsuccinyl-CoA thiolase [Gammaproteobacteria bacterium]|nr:benzoylsuccinyl-CoA thiolase [Gammaproteobacteria bacterium]
MNSKQRVAARDNWYTLDADKPRLLGSQCAACETFYFPKHDGYCRNPACDGEAFNEVELSHRGRIWSYTNAGYPPPPPFVAHDPYEPFAIAAVELEAERIVVLGQLASGVTVDDVSIGDEVEITLETLFEDDDNEFIVWKWQPVAGAAS